MQGSDGVQTPERQKLQVPEAPQGVSSVWGGFVQRPVLGLHWPATWQSSNAVQTIGVETHCPLEQILDVHLDPNPQWRLHAPQLDGSERKSLGVRQDRLQAMVPGGHDSHRRRRVASGAPQTPLQQSALSRQTCQACRQPAAPAEWRPIRPSAAPASPPRTPLTKPRREWASATAFTKSSKRFPSMIRSR
jgi:hypothetical protein